MIDALYEKLKPFLWVPVAAPFGRSSAGAFSWAGPDAGPLAHRHPTLTEFARYWASFGDPQQHPERDTSEAERYLARHRKLPKSEAA